MSDKKRRQLGPSQSRRRRPMAEAFVDQDAAAAERPVQMFNIRMDKDLHTRLKGFAFREDRPMKDVVEEALRDYLDTHES